MSTKAPDLGKLVSNIVLDEVTTDQCAKAARYIEVAGGPPDLLAMLGIDDTGLAEGIARGVWTEVPA